MTFDPTRALRAANRFARAPRLPRPARVRFRLGDVVKLLRKAKAQATTGTPSADTAPLPVPKGSQFLTRSFSCAAGTRAYKLYVPEHRPAGPPLLLMLHGCTQNADDFARGTRMNALAEEFGFLVVYPQQPASANAQSCWNWFQPQDQARGAGEPAIIAGLTRAIVREFDADPRRIFIAGLSAGGAMAAVMGAAYPDLYAGVGVHSGLPVGCAFDVVTAFAAMRGDHKAAEMSDARDGGARLIVFHGSDDKTVHPSNADVIVGNAMRDDHTPNREHGASGGRSHVRLTLRDADDVSRVEYWRVAGGGHAWFGGDAHGSFTDATGPDASREMVRFFLE